MEGEFSLAGKRVEKETELVFYPGFIIMGYGLR